MNKYYCSKTSDAVGESYVTCFAEHIVIKNKCKVLKNIS